MNSIADNSSVITVIIIIIIVCVNAHSDSAVCCVSVASEPPYPPHVCGDGLSRPRGVRASTLKR